MRPNLLRIWVGFFVFLLLPALAFAQTQSDPTAFPFLSLDVSGLADLKGAFLVQWRLFHTTAIGASNQPSALYFLTLAATLCGALFIVFNRAAHTPKVYVSWLLLVVICLFGPYQSQLLFYPAVKASDPIVSGIDPKTFCKEDTAACGFAPQMVAAHIGTTLELVFYDTFNSVNFKGMMDGIIAGLRVSHASALDAGGSWLADANQFAKTCQGSPILPSTLTTGNSTQAGTADASAPYSISSAMDRIKGYYQQIADGGVAADFSTPPPAIILDPNNADFAYRQAVGKLCQAVLGNSGAANTACGNPDNLPSSQVVYTDNSAATALLAKAGYANANAENSPGGRFINSTVDGAVTLINYVAPGFQAKTSVGVEGNPDPSSIYFYLRAAGATDAADTARQQAADCKKAVRRAYNCSELWTKAQWALGKPIILDSSTTPAEQPLLTPELLQTISTLSTGAVAVREYSNPTTSVATASPCTPERGNALFNAMFDNGYKTPGRSNPNGSLLSNFSKLRDLITNPTSDVPATFTVNDISTCTSTSCETLPTAQDLVSILNTEPMHSKLANAGNLATKKIFLANFFEQLVASSTADKSQSPASKAAMTNTTMIPQVVGDVSQQPITFLGSTVGAWVGDLIELAANGLVWLGSKFIGPMSVAVLHFTKIIVEMSLVAIIIITPVAFLIGIAIPTHANGLIIQSFLFVFVLKMVPVTFLIVDNIAGLIYRAFGAIGNDGIKQDIFVFAMAGMYTNIVGLTLLLLFKLGDVNNIQKLTEIDSAANKIAEKGAALAGAAAMVVARIAGGGAVAGVSHVAGALAAKADQKKKDALAQDVLTGGEAAVEDGAPPDGEGPDGLTLGIGPRTPEEIAEEEARRREEENRNWSGVPTQPIGGTGSYVDAMRRDASIGGGTGGSGQGPQGPDDLGGVPMDGIGPEGPLPNTGGAAATFETNAEDVGAERVAGQGPAQGQPPSGRPPGRAPTGPSSSGRLPSQTSGSSTDPNATGAANPNAPTSAAAAPFNLEKLESYLQDILGTLRDGINLTIPGNIPAHLRAVAEGLAREAEKPSAIAANELIEAEGLKLRGRGEVKPGFLRTVGSGMVGGFMAGGGLSQIPGIGKVLGEMLNEYTEAPERARVWANKGGMRKWFQARIKAERLEAAKKMGAAYGAADEYDGLLSNGMLTASIDEAVLRARQSVADAITKSNAHRIVEQKRGGKELGVDDFVNAGLPNAIESLEKTLKNAAFFGGEAKINVGTSQAPQEVMLNASVLHRMVTARAFKEAESAMSSVLADHMYISQKGVSKNTSTLYRGMMTGDRVATARFIQDAIGRDYQPAAYQKIIDGKEKFNQMQGVMVAYQDAIAKQAVMKVKLQQELNAGRITQPQFDAMVEDLPVNRINNAAYWAGRSFGATKSYRAKGWEDMPKELNTTLQQLGNAMKDAQKAAAMIPALAAQMQQAAQSLNLGSSEIANIPTALQDRLDMGNRAAAPLGRRPNAADANRRAAFEDVLEQSGFSQDQIDQIIKKLNW